MSSPVLVIVRPRNSSSGGMTLTFIIRLLQRCEPNFNSHGCQRVPIVVRNKEWRWTALTPLKLRATSRRDRFPGKLIDQCRR